MKIAFYKGKGFIDKIICWWIKSPFSHSEIFFDELDITYTIDVNTVSHFEHKQYNSDWEFIDIPINSENLEKIYRFCLKEINCKYDFMGILFSIILFLSREDKEKWFCSELCVAALQEIGMLKYVVPHEVDPGELYKLIKERLR